ncbi:MAG: hypothetical protein JWP41_3549 [Ramlibacter sp.]|nr:hypothetical protein [Ramlibacter sp.]
MAKQIQSLRLRLGIATWIVLLGAMATMPLCVFLYASYRSDVGALRAEAEATQRREAAHAARTVMLRIQLIASQLVFIDRIAELKGGQLGVADRQLARGLLGLVDQAPAGSAAALAAPGHPGPQFALSTFQQQGGQEIAFLSVRRPNPGPGSGATITGKISVTQLLAADAAADGLFHAYLIDQDGHVVAAGPPDPDSIQDLPLLRAADGGTGQRVDLARLRAWPAAAEVEGGWSVAVARTGGDVAQREATIGRRFLLGGALSLCVGLVLLHFVARRLRAEIDDVVTDFGDLDGEAPSSVISEFHEIGGALASARAKAGRTARELELAKHDSLTGLPGRELFLQRAQAQVDVARATEDCGVAVLYIDLDGFKAVNDTLGHKAGDQILRDVAATLRQCVRSPDAVGRTGGDEFVVCFAAPRQNLNDLATRACERISAGVSALGSGVGCSIGWATSSSGRNLLELIEEADAAMYLAKSARRHEQRRANA